MAHDVVRVTDNVSPRNPEESPGRLDKKPLSDILILVFSPVIPFRKYLFNTSLVLPFSLTSFCKSSCNNNPHLLHQQPCPPSTPAALVLGKTWVLCSVSRARNMSRFHLASLMPSSISTQHLPGFLPGLLHVPSPLLSLDIVAHVPVDAFHALSFPCKGTAMNHCFSPRLVFNSPSQLLFSKLFPHMAAWAGGLSSPKCRVPWGVRGRPCTTDGQGGGCSYPRLACSPETEILQAFRGPQFCSYSCFLLEPVSQ